MQYINYITQQLLIGCQHYKSMDIIHSNCFYKLEKNSCMVFKHLQSPLTFNTNGSLNLILFKPNSQRAAQNIFSQRGALLQQELSLCGPGSGSRCIHQRIKFIPQRDRRPRSHSSKPGGFGCFLSLNLKTNSSHYSWSKEDVRLEKRDRLTSSVFMPYDWMPANTSGRCFEGVHAVDCS